MSNERVQRDMIRQVFWDRLAESAPLTRELLDHTADLFEKIWKATTTEIGEETSLEISVGADGKLRSTQIGWLILGLTGIAAFNMAVKQSQKTLDKVMEELRGSLEQRLGEIDQRVKNIEEDLGIVKPF